MLVRAGASNREMALAMGVDIKKLVTLVFGFGAALCAIAGAMLGPILAVQVGMGTKGNTLAQNEINGSGKSGIVVSGESQIIKANKITGNGKAIVIQEGKHDVSE